MARVKKRELNWQGNYDSLMCYIQEYGHLPDKRKVDFRALRNWWKYNRRLILQGKLDERRTSMLDELGKMRNL